MTTPVATGWRQSRPLSALVVGVIAVGLLGLLGARLPAEHPTFRPDPLPTVGRTTTVCARDPSGSSAQAVTAVAVQSAPGRTGSLTGRALGSSETSTPLFSLTDQGRTTQAAASAPVVLTGEGVMATAGAGAVFDRSSSGDEAGLSYGPCTAPGTSFWFVGLGVTDDARSTLMLTNPDDSQSEIDLDFYGRSGAVVVAGSPGVIVPARSSREVALAPLVGSAAGGSGPLSVRVRATKGRVSAVALDHDGAAGHPAGVDWHAASASPARRVVVPGVPAGAGTRRLVVLNPGERRAQVAIEALGQDSAFTPIGAGTLDVGPGSTAQVELSSALGGQSVALRLTSDSRVSAAVTSTSSAPGQASDIAVQPATVAVRRTAVAPVGLVDGLATSVVLSNAGSGTEPVSVEALSSDGRSLGTLSVLLPTGTTATRSLRLPAPGYVVVRARDGAQVHAELVLTEAGGTVAGLSTLPLISPDVASRAPALDFDSATGR